MLRHAVIDILPSDMHMDARTSQGTALRRTRDPHSSSREGPARLGNEEIVDPEFARRASFFGSASSSTLTDSRYQIVVSWQP